MTYNVFSGTLNHARSINRPFSSLLSEEKQKSKLKQKNTQNDKPKQIHNKSSAVAKIGDHATAKCAKKWRGLLWPFPWEGESCVPIQHNVTWAKAYLHTKWHLELIHPAVWPQQTWVENWGGGLLCRPSDRLNEALQCLQCTPVGNIQECHSFVTLEFNEYSIGFLPDFSSTIIYIF